MTPVTISAIPADLLREHVLPFLGVRSIARCAKVCREWRLAVDSDAVWKPRCAALWKGKLNVPKTNGSEESLEKLSLYPFAIYNTTEMSLSVKELKQILLGRLFTQTDDFMYKHEFANAMEKTQPERFGDWQLSKTCKWKSSYLSSVLRVREFTGISKAELVRNKWTAKFNNGQTALVEFCASGTFVMPQWQENMPHMRWSFTPRPTDLEPFSHSLIQVSGPYPPLAVTRDKDWGFVLSNEHAVLYQNKD